MIEGELEKEEEDNVGSQNGQEDWRCLGLIARKQRRRHVAHHQRARDNRGHQQENPRNNAKRNHAQEDGRNVRNQRVAIQADPVSENQSLHVHALGSDPENEGKSKGVGATDRSRVQQVIDIIVKLFDVALVQVVMHVGCHLS